MINNPSQGLSGAVKVCISSIFWITILLLKRSKNYQYGLNVLHLKLKKNKTLGKCTHIFRIFIHSPHLKIRTKFTSRVCLEHQAQSKWSFGSSSHKTEPQTPNSYTPFPDALGRPGYVFKSVFVCLFLFVPYPNHFDFCVLPKIPMLKSIPQCDGIWRWSLWGLNEVMSMGPLWQHSWP